MLEEEAHKLCGKRAAYLSDPVGCSCDHDRLSLHIGLPLEEAPHPAQHGHSRGDPEQVEDLERVYNNPVDQAHEPSHQGLVVEVRRSILCH